MRGSAAPSATVSANAATHVLVERLAGGAGLLGAVEHGDRAHALGQRRREAPPRGTAGRAGPSSSPTRSPRATQRFDRSLGGAAPDPISTITRSASGAPDVVDEPVAPAGARGELVEAALRRSPGTAA